MSEFFQSGHHPDALRPGSDHPGPRHPDPDQLSAFAEQALPAHEYQETLAHLAHCPHCRSIVLLALPPIEEAPQPLPAAPPKSWSDNSWFSGWNLAWPGAAAVALASLAVVVVYVHHNQLTHNSMAMQSQVAVLRPQAQPDTAAAERAPLPSAPAPRPEQAIRMPSRSEASQPLISNQSVPNSAVPNLPLQGRNTSPLSPAAQPAFPVASGGPVPAPRTYPDAALNSPLAATSADAIRTAPAPPNRSSNVSGSTALDVDASGQSIESANAVLDSVMVSPSPAPTGARGTLKSSSSLHTFLSLKPARPLPSGLPMLSMSALNPTAANHRVLAIDAHNALFFSEDDGQHWKPVPAQWSGLAVKVNLAVSRPRPVADSPQTSYASLAAPAATGAAIAIPTPSIFGTVTDQAGAVIPNATVLLSNKETQATLSLKTNSLGRYQSPSLVPGTYQVEAEAPGFQKRLLSGISLSANQSLQSNLTLDVGTATETVTVSAAQVQLEPPASALKSKSSLAGKVGSPGISKARDPGPSENPLFEMLTNTGQRWVSPDGLLWKQAPNSPQ